MKAKADAAQKSFKQHTRLSVALLGVALVALILFVSGSLAVLSPSSFEGNDGNMIVDNPGAYDWANVPNVQSLIDTPSGSSDTSFTGGSTKEDDTTVAIGTGSIPGNKDDIQRAYVAQQEV